MRIIAVLLVATVVLLVAALWPHAGPVPSDQTRATPATLPVNAETHLLIIAPHPDDEVLAAGGLIQQVRAADGVLHVVYLTDGEGYPQGVRAEHRRRKLTDADYRAYGHQREDEARRVIRELGYGAWSQTFLGFPNGGLHRLMTDYWSDRQRAFRSKYTRLNRPPSSDVFISDTLYRGEDLSQELAEIIGAFKPSVILVPRQEDQHVDHCAAWFFVGDALLSVQRVHPQFRTDLVTYIVHYNSWLFDDVRADMPPPDDLDAGVSGWLLVPLTADQVNTKRKALHMYKSQLDVMGWFLDGFVRTNEVFSRPATQRVSLPLSKNVCDEFVER
jgi:LmbE family N-acetylglucosaminyl deacetylase